MYTVQILMQESSFRDQEQEPKDAAQFLGPSAASDHPRQPSFHG